MSSGKREDLRTDKERPIATTTCGLLARRGFTVGRRMRDKKMMSEQNKLDEGAPVVRLEFARRLRELRIPRGFRTARSLARSLEIDENRYTRYERAEVEPDLAMIRRICETLGVTPNELLGGGTSTAAAEQAGHRVGQPPEDSDGTGASPAVHNGSAIPTTAWLLAEAAVTLKGIDRTPHATPPLASMAEVGKLYRSLMQQPFEAITELLADRSIVDADPASARLLKERIDAFVAHVKARN